MLWVPRGLVTQAGEEQWASKVPRLWLSERGVHLLIEAVLCGQRCSIDHASVDKYKHYPSILLKWHV